MHKHNKDIPLYMALILKSHIYCVADLEKQTEAGHLFFGCMTYKDTYVNKHSCTHADTHATETWACVCQVSQSRNSVLNVQKL